MTKLLISLIGALILGTTLPASAGPDEQKPNDAQRPAATAPLKCPPDKPVLQLDHGPRAQTTTYQNQRRKERYEAQLKACKEAGKP